MNITKQKAEIADKYDLEPSDMMFVDLVMSGWGKLEAAFFSYHLMYDDVAKLKTFIRNKSNDRPGIEQYMSFRISEEELRNSKKKEVEKKIREEFENKHEAKIKEEVDRRFAEELETRLNEEVDNRIKQREKNLASNFVDIGNKDTMRSELIRLYNQISDPKFKLDYAKQVMSLDQMQKEQTKEIDDRIHFHTSTNCRYCNRCASCVLKDKLESLGCEVYAKSTNPLMWTISDNNADNN